MSQQIPNNPQDPNQAPRNKRPFFRLSWIYIIAIVTLGIMVWQNKDSATGGLNKEVDYSAFRSYVANGYAREVIVNKSDGSVRLVVKPEKYARSLRLEATKRALPPLCLLNTPT